jgi:hypothetical protein
MTKIYFVFCFLLLTSLSASSSEDSYLRCTRKITVHNSALPTTKDQQEIAAHIVKRSKINFSGNSLLGGDDISICPAGTLGTSHDEYLFDSESCSGSTSGQGRTYGTYNPITRNLSVSSDRHVVDVWLVEGSFACVPIKVEQHR